MPLATLEADSHAASGFGNIDAQRDLAIPYINILQPNSPQVNKTKAEFIQGATAGQFFNTVTQELSDHILVLEIHVEFVAVILFPLSLVDIPILVIGFTLDTFVQAFFIQAFSKVVGDFGRLNIQLLSDELLLLGHIFLSGL